MSDTMPKRTHTTLSGHTIEYGATPALAVFLRRLEDMISDPKVHEQEMIGVAYSRENPMLDQTMHPVRAMVTKEVFENPAYAVMADLLFRKRVVQERLDVDKIAAKYTTTVVQAAEELGLSVSAVKQAIGARRLASWVKGGQHFLDPRSLASFALSAKPRGPRPQTDRSGTVDRARVGGARELDIILGHAPGESLRVRAATGVETVDRVSGNIVHGRLAKWERVVVLTTRGENKRAFVIEPADEESEIKHGPFFVRGRFAIVEKANLAKKAGTLYDTAEVR